MSRYLEEAAALLRKAAEDNERRYQSYEALREDGRMRIADAFARLAAIEQGLMPAEWVAEVIRSVRKADRD